MREPYAELGLWKTTAPGISVYLSPQGMTALLFFHVITTVEDAAGEPCVTSFRRVKLRVVTRAIDLPPRLH